MNVPLNAILAQWAPAGDVPANAARAAALVDAHPAADLVVLPELWLCGYCPQHARERAVFPDGEELAPVRAAAARCGTSVLIGFAERREGGVGNSLLCIGPDGGTSGLYRKIMLFGDEAAAFEPGEALALPEAGGVVLGPMLCFDVEFPEIARALARAGADVLVTASANMAPYYADHRLASRARALDNRLPHLYVNRVGEESGFTFVGGTRSIGPDGRVLAELPPAGEDALEAAVRREPVGAAVDYLRLAPRVPLRQVTGATRPELQAAHARAPSPPPGIRYGIR